MSALQLMDPPSNDLNKTKTVNNGTNKTTILIPPSSINPASQCTPAKVSFAYNASLKQALAISPGMMMQYNSEEDKEDNIIDFIWSRWGVLSSLGSQDVFMSVGLVICIIWFLWSMQHCFLWVCSLRFSLCLMCSASAKPLCSSWHCCKNCQMLPDGCFKCSMAGSQEMVWSVAYHVGMMTICFISCSVSLVMSLKVIWSPTLCATPTQCAGSCFVEGIFLSTLR